MGKIKESLCNFAWEAAGAGNMEGLRVVASLGVMRMSRFSQ